MSVEVSTNGQDYSSSGVHFEYQQPVAVRALEPSRGPIEGGTFVNVTGSGFSARAALLGYVWCRFNSTSVAAAWRSARIGMGQPPPAPLARVCGQVVRMIVRVRSLMRRPTVSDTLTRQSRRRVPAPRDKTRELCCGRRRDRGAVHDDVDA